MNSSSVDVIDIKIIKRVLKMHEEIMKVLHVNYRINFKQVHWLFKELGWSCLK